MAERFQVIVAGSRGFSDQALMDTKLDHYFAGLKPTAIISGGARGADSMGEAYAKSRDIPVLRFPAQWDKYGRRAGYLRNAQMLEVADALVAFWDGSSRGTKHMIDISKAKGIQVRVVKI